MGWSVLKIYLLNEDITELHQKGGGGGGGGGLMYCAWFYDGGTKSGEAMPHLLPMPLGSGNIPHTGDYNSEAEVDASLIVVKTTIENNTIVWYIFSVEKF